MKERLGLAFLMVCAGTTLIGLSQRDYHEVIGDLGAGLIEAAITIGIIDYIFERARKLDGAKEIARRALLEVDHAVWVWQGGSREFFLEELELLLAHVKESDPVPPFTENLFLLIGSRAENTMQISKHVIDVIPRLRVALTELGFLARVRDDVEYRNPLEIRKRLQNGARILAEVLRETRSSHLQFDVEKLRNVSPRAQELRHFGRSSEDPTDARPGSLKGVAE
jgi:hypothetical protein